MGALTDAGHFSHLMSHEFVASPTVSDREVAARSHDIIVEMWFLSQNSPTARLKACFERRTILEVMILRPA